ncbi:MAG: nickel pincer cofactor biosynthesis protein LarC, partial [bacterium]
GATQRDLADIVEIIDESSISEPSKATSKRIFQRLAEAEAKVHNTSPDRVHFHEIGATDAIVDVVGAVVGLELLRVKQVYSSPLRFGTGFVEGVHGPLPVPAPATVELTRGVPVRATHIEAELVTPTGAAIITTLAESFDEVPPLKTESIGYGVGARQLKEIPNLLRVEIGESDEALLHDQSIIIETNIDDMNPEVYGYLTDRLFEEGAKDVYLTQVIMKKSRPGVLVSVLVDPSSVNRISSLIFKETTTLGLRIYPVQRQKLRRNTETIQTQYGQIRIKTTIIDGEKRCTPEYEDCLRIAQKKGVPILEVYEEVMRKTRSIKG